MEEIKNELMAYLPKLICGIESMVCLFHEGDNQKGFGLLGQVVEGIDWACKAYLEIYPQKLEDIYKLNGFLSCVNDALTSKDYVLVADIFEYDVLDALKDILGNALEANITKEQEC